MSILGAFSISTQGMRSQATALGVIGTNVANINTGGYKRTDPFFQTLKSDPLFEQSDLNGMKPVVSTRVSIQGTLAGSVNDLDLAIIGQGLFVTRTTFDTSGEALYTRDGSFAKLAVNDITVTDPVDGTTLTTKDAYLVDKNGNFLLGYAANADGTFPTTGVPAPMRVDQHAFANTGKPTTSIDLAFNVDSNAPVVTITHQQAVDALDTGGIHTPGLETHTIDFIDSLGVRQSARLNFTKSAQNQWEMSASYQSTPTAQIDTVTIGGTIETGDSYSVTVDGTTISYTAIAGDTTSSVVSNLVSRLNASNPVSLSVTATAGTAAGTISLTSANPGTAMTTSVASADGGGNADNTSSVVTTTANNTGLVTTTPTTVNFTSGGIAGTTTATVPPTVIPPAPILFVIPYPASTPGGAASTATFTMDISGFTQFAAGFGLQRYDHDGYEASSIGRVGFDERGHVLGFFASGDSVQLYQVPLAKFSNPDALASENGMTFRETVDSGTPTIETIDASGIASFVPHALEVSNVSLVDEFSAIIKTQRAYSSSARAFQTVNEMLQVIKDMKR